MLRATALAGGRQRGGSSSRRGAFNGSQIGRGAGIGRVLGSRDRYAAFRSRRVAVKARIIKLTGKGGKAALAHLHYIQRDGVTREGEPGRLYDAQQDRADGKAFIEHADGDRHQFRFTVSAEDGDAYEDLKSLTRLLMAQMEQDLGTRLEWVKVEAQACFATIIVCTLLAPLFVTLGDGVLLAKVVPSFLSVTAGVLTSWLQLRKPQRLWVLYRRAQRELEEQKANYDFTDRDFADAAEPNKLLARKVTHVARWVHDSWEGLVPEPEMLASGHGKKVSDKQKTNDAATNS